MQVKGILSILLGLLVAHTAGAAQSELIRYEHDMFLAASDNTTKPAINNSQSITNRAAAAMKQNNAATMQKGKMVKPANTSTTIKNPNMKVNTTKTTVPAQINKATPVARQNGNVQKRPTRHERRPVKKHDRHHQHHRHHHKQNVKNYNRNPDRSYRREISREQIRQMEDARMENYMREIAPDHGPN